MNKYEEEKFFFTNVCSKTSLHIVRGRHVWPLCAGLCLLHHLLLQSTSHPYIGPHFLYTSPGMEQSHFTWFFGRRPVHCTFRSTLLPEYRFHDMSGWPPCADLLLQVGYCYIHVECRIWRIVFCPVVSPLLLVYLALGCGPKLSKCSLFCSR